MMERTVARNYRILYNAVSNHGLRVCVRCGCVCTVCTYEKDCGYAALALLVVKVSAVTGGIVGFCVFRRVKTRVISSALLM